MGQKLFIQTLIIINTGRIGGVMVSVLASSVVDHWFKSRPGQTKDYKTGICSSSTSKTGRHDIAEISLKVALKHKKSNQIKSQTRRAH